MIACLHIGNDISKRWFDIFYVLGKEEVHARFQNTQAGHLEFIESVKGLARKIHICMEFTGGYETPLALACKEVMFKVSLIPGAKIAAYRKSFSSTGASTDKKSAYLLARFCKERTPEQWIPMSQEYLKLRELVRHRESLIKNKTEWSLRAGCFVYDELVQAQRQTIVEVLKLQLEKIEEEIAKHIRAHENLKQEIALLDSIPGIAAISAARILAETGSIEHYDDAKSYALSAGLVPIAIHSGVKTPAGKLPVYGNKELRTALYFPAVVCFEKELGVGPFMKRVAANGDKTKMTVIAAGMRKLSHIVFGVLKHKKKFDPAFLAEN